MSMTVEQAIELIKGEPTAEQCQEIGKTEWWKAMSLEEVTKLQLYQRKLCCPFTVYHEGLGVLLKRSVWNHEIGDTKALQEEYEGKRTAPDNPFESLMSILEKANEHKVQKSKTLHAVVHGENLSEICDNLQNLLNILRSPNVESNMISFSEGFDYELDEKRYHSIFDFNESYDHE